MNFRGLTILRSELFVEVSLGGKIIGLKWHSMADPQGADPQGPCKGQAVKMGDHKMEDHRSGGKARKEDR